MRCVNPAESKPTSESTLCCHLQAKKEHQQGKEAPAGQQPKQQASGSEAQRQKAAKAGIAAAYGGIAMVTAMLGVALLFFTPQVPFPRCCMHSVTAVTRCGSCMRVEIKSMQSHC